MKRNFLYLMIGLTIAASCSKDKAMPHMTMITKAASKVLIGMRGNGTAIINWGDSSPSEICTLSSISTELVHNYSGSTSHIITIAGEHITQFGCASNQLISLDVSNNAALTHLYCHDNQLTSLDVSKNTALTNMDCRFNQLTSLDMSKNTALTYMQCSVNQLTSLDVSKNTALTFLSCGASPLTSLDVSKNTELTTLYYNNNKSQADALNALFGTLPTIVSSVGYIYIGGNPGVTDAALDTSIATAKGWIVNTSFVWQAEN